MTRRSDKQDAGRFMVPDKWDSTVWAVTDYCDPECQAEGTNVVALFTNEQIAAQFADARKLPAPHKMRVYRAMTGV